MAWPRPPKQRRHCYARSICHARSAGCRPTAAATVNGEDILATTWYQATQNLEQDETQRSNQSISLDERQRLMDQAYDQLVSDALLRQEYRRRGITVTDDEILQAARYSPPPQLTAD